MTGALEVGGGSGGGFGGRAWAAASAAAAAASAGAPTAIRVSNTQHSHSTRKGRFEKSHGF